MRAAQHAVAAAQGAYFTATGVWPLVHMRSFLAVTGPKRDLWLVQTVGVLVAVIGGTLVRAAARGETTPAIQLLATGSATGLAAIDVVHVVRRRIQPIYLADALAEVALLAVWAFARRRAR